MGYEKRKWVYFLQTCSAKMPEAGDDFSNLHAEGIRQTIFNTFEDAINYGQLVGMRRAFIYRAPKREDGGEYEVPAKPTYDVRRVEDVARSARPPITIGEPVNGWQRCTPSKTKLEKSVTCIRLDGIDTTWKLQNVIDRIEYTSTLEEDKWAPPVFAGFAVCDIAYHRHEWNKDSQGRHWCAVIFRDYHYGDYTTDLISVNAGGEAAMSTHELKLNGNYMSFGADGKEHRAPFKNAWAFNLAKARASRNLKLSPFHCAQALWGERWPLLDFTKLEGSMMIPPFDLSFLNNSPINKRNIFQHHVKK